MQFSLAAVLPTQLQSREHIPWLKSASIGPLTHTNPVRASQPQLSIPEGRDASTGLHCLQARGLLLPQQTTCLIKPLLRRSKGCRKGKPGQQQVPISKHTAALSRPLPCIWNCCITCALTHALNLRLDMWQCLCFASVTECTLAYNPVHSKVDVSAAHIGCTVLCSCHWIICTSLVFCRMHLAGF